MSLVILDDKLAQIVARGVVTTLVDRLKTNFEFHLQGGSNRYDEINRICLELQNLARQLEPKKPEETKEVKF